MIVVHFIESVLEIVVALGFVGLLILCATNDGTRG